MKILPTTNINLNKAVRLSKGQPHATIWRYNLDQYIITTGLDNQPVHAFESFEFSVLLHVAPGDIIDFALIESKCLLCDGCHQFKELRIQTADGSAFSIDDGGVVVSITELSLDADVNKTSSNPMENWGLPDQYPYNRLRISDDLVDVLEENHMSATSINDVVDRLWIDLRHTEKPLNMNVPVDVAGEFVHYAALELKCGRIVLMTEAEKASLLSSDS